jgi:hypothetical protein
VQGEHVYEIGPSGVLVHNKCAGYHHFWSHAWGNKIPYKHPVLTFLTESEHTDIHRQLSKFLFQKNEHYFNSMSGKQWVKKYGMHQLTAGFMSFTANIPKPQWVRQLRSVSDIPCMTCSTLSIDMRCETVFYSCHNSSITDLWSQEKTRWSRRMCLTLLGRWKLPFYLKRWWGTGHSLERCTELTSAKNVGK